MKTKKEFLQILQFQSVDQAEHQGHQINLIQPNQNVADNSHRFIYHVSSRFGHDDKSIDNVLKQIKASRIAVKRALKDKDLYYNIYFAKKLQLNRKNMRYLSYLRKIQRDLIAEGDPLKKNLVEKISIFASLIESLDFSDKESIQLVIRIMKSEDPYKPYNKQDLYQYYELESTIKTLNNKKSKLD